MASADTTSAPVATVLLSRDGFGDQRRFRLPVEAVEMAHWTDVAGGDRHALPAWSLAVRIPQQLYPFPRSGWHPRRNSTMVMLIEVDGTDASVVAQLREEAVEFLPSRKFMRWRRCSRGLSAGVAVLDYIDGVSAAVGLA